MGMSADQFFQVVLLPQGEFAQFLHADAERPGRAAAAAVRHRPVPRGGGVAGPPPEGHRDEVEQARHGIAELVARIAQAAGARAGRRRARRARRATAPRRRAHR